MFYGEHLGAVTTAPAITMTVSPVSPPWYTKLYLPAIIIAVLAVPATALVIYGRKTRGRS